MKNRYPRELAVRVLTRVLSDREQLDTVLDELASNQEVPRAWLQEICAGSLRWRGRLDEAIDSASLKKKPSGWLRKALMLGVYQLLAQDRVNPGAVVSETVDAIKKKEGAGPAGFANALLRKCADHASQWKELAFPAAKNAAEQSRWASVPEWMWKLFVADHGLEWAKAFAMASLQRPELWIRAKDGLAEAWGEKGDAPGSLKVTNPPIEGPITEWPGFKEGMFFVQDISSQTLIAEVTKEAQARLGKSDFRALDTCAAPGGKTAGLAWNGAVVSATDRDLRRLGLLRQTVERVARSVRIVEGNNLKELSEFDLVWVDAPCSGSGVIRRHPDIRWIRREDELKALTKVQEELLKSGLAKVRSGGLLVYSVCSVFKQEGLGTIERAGLKDSVVKEWFFAPQTSPYGDGFYGALIQKT
jgi:16S rRNA (cytosine967-C5)-methyltransferase